MRRVVFASGKGGTGKTTLTALVAREMAAVIPLVLADCDVEAANLPIALAAQEIECEPFAGASSAVIDATLCRGCGACVPVCRFDAIAPVDAFPCVRAFEIDRWACEGCRACVPACAYGAITMRPSQAGEVCRARTDVGSMTFGRLAPGEDLSGKLVTEVRGRADALGERDAAEVMLIDGPPGVGCPAIAAITNTDLLIAVTEPTLSGEHDLLRLLTLARHLRVPVSVVLNKADLSDTGAERIRARARAEGLELIAEVPYDPGMMLVGSTCDLTGVCDGSTSAAVLSIVAWLAAETA